MKSPTIKLSISCTISWVTVSGRLWKCFDLADTQHVQVVEGMSCVTDSTVKFINSSHNPDIIYFLKQISRLMMIYYSMISLSLTTHNNILIIFYDSKLILSTQYIDIDIFSVSWTAEIVMACLLIFFSCCWSCCSCYLDTERAHIIDMQIKWINQERKSEKKGLIWDLHLPSKV